ncbi:hypothetical protein, partial [Escherichia coli]|uniref:hypothetical protein n=2 Tax=Pseudomonadota TaxID=1224 RepID=UPI003CF32DAA
EQFTCGISQASSGGSAPLCAAPLLGWNLNLFQPANTVLLAFEAASRNVGSVTHRLLAPSLLIDMSAPGADSASVTYD